MKIPLIGQTNKQFSVPFNAGRAVNLYTVSNETGKEPTALYGTAGIKLFSTADNGPIRGEFSSTNGRAFVVSANKLYEVLSDGYNTERGTILTSSSIVSMSENPTQLAICDGTSVYIFTYATNVLAKVTDPDLPVASTICFLDGYFIINKTKTGSFYISQINNGTSWEALDFATAESSPDQLKRVLSGIGQLWLLGDKTSEIWTNTGASSFPFERVSGAKMEVGILAPHTALAIDNSVFWVGKDDIGSGIVYRANGYTPQRISTEAIELIIQSASDIENLRAYTYQESGHVFYVITGGSLETTLVYDISTGLWHERAYLVDGEYQPQRGCCGMFAFGKYLVGDSENGNIYHLSQNFYSDNGDEIVRDFISNHISNENERFRVNTLELAMEVGVGLQTGQGSDPKVSLRVSTDQGQTWSNWYDTPIGKAGKYKTKVSWNRLGTAETFTFWVRISDPVKVSLIGMYMR
jgi:hypothetical protein